MTKKGTYSSKKRAWHLYLVDDHPMMLEGLQRLIEGEPDFVCCGSAASAEQAFQEILRQKPDLVITDIKLQGRGGIELIKDVLAVNPEILFLVVSMLDETFYAGRALRAGARGYLMKESGGEKILQAIHKVLAGEMSVSPQVSASILEHFSARRPRRSSSPLESLTDREFDVFQLIGQGKTTREIADSLHLSHKTVAVYRGNIKDKLGLITATDLVRHAVRWVETQELK